MQIFREKHGKGYYYFVAEKGVDGKLIVRSGMYEKKKDAEDRMIMLKRTD